VLSDVANASIPERIRERFPRDDQGRVLFFTKPPRVPDQIVRGRDGQPLAHSEKYLAAKAERDKLIATRKRAREEEEKKKLAEAKRARQTNGATKG
jgi:chromatin structure-remodeling complex subunit RSC1/2